MTGALVALLMLAASASSVHAQVPFGPTQDPTAGARVFGAKGCGRCHAVGGAGGKIGPDLGQSERSRSFYDLASALWNHAPRMADRMRQMGLGRPRLDAQEAGDLVAFLFTLNYFDPRGNERTGRRLFTDKKCVLCHQVGGVGGVVGPNLDAIGEVGSPMYLAAAMWNHLPRMSEAMKARGLERPTFRDTELVDLVAFIVRSSPSALQGPLHVLPGRADEGRRLFAEKRCAECHSAGGQGGRSAPDLARRGLHRSMTQFVAAMWNKAPVMLEAMRARSLPAPQIRPEEMADIVAYLYSVRYFAGSGDVRNGERVAASAGCLVCHALRGEQGKPAGDLARARDVDQPPGVLAALWNHSFVSDPRSMRDKPAWTEIGPRQMADLSAFLASLKSAP